MTPEPEWQAQFQPILRRDLDRAMNEFSARIDNRDRGNEPRPVSMQIGGGGAVFAPSSAILGSDDNPAPAIPGNSGDDSGTPETVTGAVNGVPATLVVMTDGTGWTEI